MTLRLADWIAHGLMDSIVDGFFPIINSIEQEVDDIDSIVADIDAPRPTTSPAEPPKGSPPELPSPSEKLGGDSNNGSPTVRATSPDPEKDISPKAEPAAIRFKDPFYHSYTSSVSRNVKAALHLFRRHILRQRHDSPGASSRGALLLRMAASRRLVTALTRILTPKSEVVTQMRKRLTMSGGVIGPSKAVGSSGLELDIYFGDVQGESRHAHPRCILLRRYHVNSDHIVTMQQALAQYERILSSAHPMYLSHLRYSLSNAKGGNDKAIVTLTSVSIICLSIQLCLSMYQSVLSSSAADAISSAGAMSMNCNVPHNRRPDENPPDYSGPIGHFYVFGGVVAVVTVVASAVLALIRFWWRQARRKYRRHTDI